MSTWFVGLSRACAVASSFVALFIARQSHAQSEPSDCIVAARAAERGEATKDDVGRLARCPVTGPAALSKVWSDPALSARIGTTLLVRAATDLPDARLFRAVLAVGGDRSKASATRLAALEVLVSYYDPRFAASAQYLNEGKIGDPIPMRAFHPPTAGAEALPMDRANEIHSLLVNLVQDSDGVVRNAALRVRQGLAYVDPEHTPVAQGVITLLAGCGPRVTLRSSADISLPLRVRVLESSYDQVLWLKGLVDGQPSKLLLGLPKGAVVVTVGGNEVARLTRREGPCPPSE